jgi:uncharacterized protein YndB with AHSA1/START domain
MTKGKRRIEMYFEIRAKPGAVFDALTVPAQLRRWFVDSARIDARKGGEFDFGWDSGYRHAGKVLECKRGESLVLEWTVGGMRTRIAFHLRRLKGGTLLRFRETGIDRHAPSTLNFLGLYSGWVYYLAHLRALVETGVDLRRPRDRYW